MPIPCFEDIASKTEVGYGMGKDAMGNAFRVVIDAIKNHSRHDPSKNVVMFQAEQDTYSDK